MRVRAEMHAGCITSFILGKSAKSSLMAEGGDIPKKITEYERFLNERLKTDLKSILEIRDNVYSDVAEYMQLKNVIETVGKKGGGEGEEDRCLKTMVDLGCNFYSQACIPDPSRVCVAVGFGVFVELSHDEALKFIDKKVAHLNKKANELTEQACQVKARIRIVVEALQEIQFTKLPTTKPHRAVW